ncbi:MAG: hypothetical protein KZQ77_10450 [Candidatus Thiodiazotropha sp. (ex Notomyrtea botanica)]|nr:hypothetical protein [Candidatus Thiodiazotropha sp. (ex Notomyrtea botanica)]
MKLNDPFGRLESRHQAGYETMRDALRRGGIDSPQAAQGTIRQAWKRGFTVMGVGMLLLLLLMAVIPSAAPLVLGLALFMVVWVVSSTINGQRYIKRYIEEELKH